MCMYVIAYAVKHSVKAVYTTALSASLTLISATSTTIAESKQLNNEKPTGYDIYKSSNSELILICYTHENVIDASYELMFV